MLHSFLLRGMGQRAAPCDPWNTPGVAKLNWRSHGLRAGLRPQAHLRGGGKGRRQGWKEGPVGRWRVSAFSELSKQGKATFNTGSACAQYRVSIPLKAKPSHRESSPMELEGRLRLGFQAPVLDRGDWPNQGSRINTNLAPVCHSFPLLIVPAVAQ